jgi:ATP phosphoribosyltransferase
MIKIAIQKNGRLSDLSLALLKNCGISTPNGDRKLKSRADNFPLEILFLRDDDIPEYVEKGVADIGIIGENEVWEKAKDIDVIKQLGFAKCKMALAVSKEEEYIDLNWFNNKTIATSYPGILNKFLAENNITANIEVISGSVEIAPGIGLAQGIFDIVSTGSTLIMNGLKEVETVCKSEAVLVANKNLSEENKTLLQRLLFRVEAVQKASKSKYILLNAPKEQVEAISKLLPSMKSPTILPLLQEGWCSLHSVINEEDFWEVIEQLKNLGAEGILVIPIEKMIA